jgi:transposase-like protein
MQQEKKWADMSKHERKEILQDLGIPGALEYNGTGDPRVEGVVALRKDRRLFDESFQEECVRRVERGEISAKNLAAELDVQPHLITRWKKKYGGSHMQRSTGIEPLDRKLGMARSEYIAFLERKIGQLTIELERCKRTQGSY